jgi:hypothetical protein
MNDQWAMDKLVLVVDGLIGAVNELALQATVEHDIETGTASEYMGTLQAELDAVRVHLGARSWDEVHPTPSTPTRHIPPQLRYRYGKGWWRRG